MAPGQMQMPDMLAGNLGRVRVQRLGTEGGSETCEIEDVERGPGSDAWWLFAGHDREHVTREKTYADNPLSG